MPPAIVPTATYRLQFNASFTFDAAAAIVEYLHTLGISHCCASSYFKAVPGSTHGYDVADPTQLNPEIGDHDTFDRWVNTLRARVWGDARMRVTESAPRCYKQLFTRRCVPAIENAGRTWLKAADVFEAFPIGFLEAA
jgi:hypothetical protein